jgi:hypothetical protein
MEVAQADALANRPDLQHKRLQLHGHRRTLHDRLSEVCEAFVVEEDLSREFKQNTLVRELEYLLDYYRDEENWQGVD